MGEEPPYRAAQISSALPDCLPLQERVFLSWVPLTAQRGMNGKSEENSNLCG